MMQYHCSPDLTIGIEIELQLINPITGDLATGARHLIKNLKRSPCQKLIKPEVTQSMLEINSSVHQHPQTLLEELRTINKTLVKETKALGILLCGGGTHPFQKWKQRKIYPTKRFLNLYKQYGYLVKRFTIFGQHVHIGCSCGDKAIYLTLALSRYIPQLIALAGSSPLYQGVDTGFDSSRTSIVNAFPLSGFMPYQQNWQTFSTYVEEMAALNIIQTMKDFYWDIRPKPDTGTVEIRICDTPLTPEMAAMIAAYIQVLCHFLLETYDKTIDEQIYMPYSYNRFQASRYGFEGIFINPYTKQKQTIQEDMLETIDNILPYAKISQSKAFIQKIKNRVKNKFNDACLIRKLRETTASLSDLTIQQASLWMSTHHAVI